MKKKSKQKLESSSNSQNVQGFRPLNPKRFEQETLVAPKAPKDLKEPKEVKKKPSVLKWIAFLLPVFIMLSGIGVWAYLFGDLKSGETVESLSSEHESRILEETLPVLSVATVAPTETVEVVDYPEEQSNILIVGVDSRDMNNINTNADAILVLSINQKKGEVKLTSFQRDLYVYVPWKESFQKLNSAMFGGPETLMNLLNYNYKLNLQKYVVVNFQALSDLVDLVGGVEVEIPDNQQLIDHLNYFVGDSNRLLGGEASPAIEKPGVQVITGRQALAFARIRYIDTDFLRMKRQQQIIKGLFQRVKQQGPLELLQLMKTAMGYLRTNLSSLEIAGLATSVLPKLSQSFETINVPLEGYYKGVTLKGTYYTVQAINAQMPLLHEFIYGNQQYIGSPVVEYYPSAEELAEIAQKEAEEKEKEKEKEEQEEQQEENP